MPVVKEKLNVVCPERKVVVYPPGETRGTMTIRKSV
jgi:hypothetical protein